MDRVCQSCYKRTAIKQVLSANRRSKIWKCQTCIDHKNESDLSRKNEPKYFRR